MSSETPLLGGGGLNLFLRPRPKHEIVGQKGKKEEFTSQSPDTLLFLTQCEDYEISLHGVAVKIILERCSNVIVNVNSRLISGLIEVISSSGITINILQDVQVPTITADGVKTLNIKIAKQDQFKSIYTKDCTKVVLHVMGDDLKHDIKPPMDEPNNEQFLTHLKEVDGVKQLFTEKVIRLGLFPSTADEKAEHEKNKEQIEKGLNEMFNAAIHPKGQRKT